MCKVESVFLHVVVGRKVCVAADLLSVVEFLDCLKFEEKRHG
jgi:hypothetical protein